MPFAATCLTTDHL